MRHPSIRLVMAAALFFALVGCGGGGGDSGSTPPPPPAQASVKDQIAAAAVVAGNDTSANSIASFTIIQNAGMPAVSVKSPPKVNFTVFSDGAVVQGLTNANVRFAIAKLVPGTNGDPDKWLSYIYRTETATAGVGPNGAPVLASAQQATTDPNTPEQLVYSADGYYTYTFSTDIKDPTKTNGVTFEPGLTHRIGIQLSYKNKAGETVLVNPYFEFTIDGNGNSVAVTDPSKTRKMVDIGTCNGCHTKLGLHGGGRVDTQFCVLCHNPGTTDANSGNVLTLATMVHKIHAGKELNAKGEDYVIWGFRDSRHDYAEVGFPQPIRNCAACHDGSNPKTPQGDNWKTKPSKEACLTCHRSNPGSNWETIHVTELKLGASVAAITNKDCAGCHSTGKTWAPEQVHWVQEMANAKLYESRIESVTLTKAPTATATGTLTVKYAVVNPATGAAYDLREGCSTAPAAAPTTDSAGTAIGGCWSNYRWDAVLPPATPTNKPTDKFGMFSVYLGVNNFAQTIDDTTAISNWTAYRGTDDGNSHYTANLTIPAGAKGNARVMMLGAVSERRLNSISRSPVIPLTDRPTENRHLAYVPVKAAIYEFDLSTGAKSTTPRRQIVSNDKCNTCHGILGLPFEADPNVTGFHKGHRNNSEGCEICHDAGRAASYTYMTDASVAPDGKHFSESYQAKRMIHGIHGGAKRTYPFTHCNNVVSTGEVGKDGKRISDGAPLACTNYPGETNNFTAEVTYPAILQNCNTCHVNDSWKQDRGLLGSVIFKGGLTDPLQWLAISPKAASCTGCHDSTAARTHVTTIGGASFGAKAQSAIVGGGVYEGCEGCHAPGGFKGVDLVHGLK